MDEIAEHEVVVCIDDEPEILSSLRRLLRNEPYVFLTTEQPDEAVRWVLVKKARFGLCRYWGVLPAAWEISWATMQPGHRTGKGSLTQKVAT